MWRPLIPLLPCKATNAIHIAKERSLPDVTFDGLQRKIVSFATFFTQVFSQDKPFQSLSDKKT
jgi:hypothetical protein